MHEVFCKHLCLFVLVFFNDILIYNRSLNEHPKNFRLVLILFRTDRLFLKRAKYSFDCQEVVYLGHVIQRSGVVVDKTKITDIVDWQLPQMTRATTTSPQQHWVSKLMGFNFTIEYQQDALNCVADALSRRGEGDPEIEEDALSVLTQARTSIFEDLREEIETDESLSAQSDYVFQGKEGSECLACEGLILFVGSLDCGGLPQLRS